METEKRDRMTENKRFQYNVNKNSIEYDGKHFAYCNGEQNKIANKLDELAEENKDNKAMIEFLNIENNQIMNELKTRTQIQHQLEEENEQLKKENYELHKRLRDFEPFERYMKERTTK